MAHADQGKQKRTKKAKVITRKRQRLVKQRFEARRRAPTIEQEDKVLPTLEQREGPQFTPRRQGTAGVSPDRLTPRQILGPQLILRSQGTAGTSPDRFTQGPSSFNVQKAILDPISPQQISTSPVVRLTAGGLTDQGLGPLDLAAPSSGIAGQDFPLVQLTAGQFGIGSNVSTQFRKVLVSADTAISQGVLYDPDLIQEGYVGPGIEGKGAFIVKDLADVALIARENPGADIYYNDPNNIGPPIAVSGTAAFIPALEKYLLTQFGGLKESIPQSVIDILVRNGLLEDDGGELFPDVPFGFGRGGFGRDRFGGGGFGGGGFGRGRAPSAGSFATGLFNWRISA